LYSTWTRKKKPVADTEHTRGDVAGNEPTEKKKVQKHRRKTPLKGKKKTGKKTKGGQKSEKKGGYQTASKRLYGASWQEVESVSLIKPCPQENGSITNRIFG